MFRRRTIILAFLFTAAFLAMAGRMWQLQVLKADYYRQMGQKRLHRLRQIPPARGRILDRRGRVLAEDVPNFELWLKPAYYKGSRRSSNITGYFPELGPDELISILKSTGNERELKSSLALGYLQQKDPLVARLAQILKNKDETIADARQRVAQAVLASLTSREDTELHSFTDSRLCFSEIPVKALIELEQLMADPHSEVYFSALSVRGGYKRNYPYGALMGHLTGYTGQLSQDEYRVLRGRWLDDGTLEDGEGKIVKNGKTFFSLAEGSDEFEMIQPRVIRRSGVQHRVKGYFANEIVGRGGVEQWYNDELRGRHVWRIEQMVKPEPGGPRVFVEAGVPRQAVNGSDITLTIDVDFQKKVTQIMDTELAKLSRLPEHQSALRRHKLTGFTGVAVVMDVRNGEIYALVSDPSFDPNALSTDFAKLLKDERKPLFNRAISGSYPPGSTLKPLVATAGLEEGKITEHTEFNCPGVLTLGQREYVCMNRHVHGDITVVDALKVSCNVYFYHLGETIGGKLLVSWLSALGLGRESGIDLPGEASGHLPAKAFTGIRWSLGETYHLAIGQGAIDATPLQMATAYAALANGGDLLRPHVRYDPADPELNTPRSKMRISPAVTKVVDEGMWKVIQWDEYPRGTAVKFAKIDGFEYMGKTGSAQKSKRDTHAWLCALAPYKKPEIVVAVLVPFGNHGGNSCGAIVRRIVEAYFNLNDRERERETDKQDGGGLG